MQRRILNARRVFLLVLFAGAMRFYFERGTLDAKPKGFRLFMASAPTIDTVVCEDYDVHAIALRGHQYKLNEDGPLDRSQMLQKLDDKLKYRAEKVMFLHADPEISWGDFSDLLDTIYRRDTAFAIMTRGLQQDITRRGGCLGIWGLSQAIRESLASGDK